MYHLPAPHDAALAAAEEAQSRRDHLLARARRCRAAGPAPRDAADAAMAAFLAAGGSVTRCPTVHLLPSP